MSEHSETVAIKVVYKSHTVDSGEMADAMYSGAHTGMHQLPGRCVRGSNPRLSMMRSRSTLDRSTAVTALSNQK